MATSSTRKSSSASTELPRAVALVNARVYTQEPRCPLAEAVAIVGNRIACVGGADEVLEAAGSQSEKIDLRWRAVVPGFVDAHFHLLGYCLSRDRVHLEGVASLGAALEIVRQAAEDLAPDAWVVGRGWNHHLWEPAELPTRHDLDRALGGRPACLLSHDVHSVWANSAALRLAGVTRDTPVPPGGRVVREADGEPSGILLESAAEAVRSLADRPSLESALMALRAGQDDLLRVGVTGVHSLEGALALRALQALDAAGELRLRVFAGISREALPSAAAVGLQTGFGSERLKIGLVKLFADGALGSGTAALIEPYEGERVDRGITILDRDQMIESMRDARAAGIGVATHAIGDAAVRAVLDAAEALRVDDPGRSQILRIEHAQLVHPYDIPRFGALGVIASMQPMHATSDMKIADRRWGERCRTAYPWRALIDSGAHLAFGTDCPVEPPDPMLGIHAAVTRQRVGVPRGGWYPEQCVSVEEAIRAYTMGSARAAALDLEHGSIAPGKLADLVVLSGDPYTTPPAQLADIDVAMTIFDGAVVHAAPGFV